ncbi:MAG: ferrous iron transport protein A [Campylobacterales bacterium]
MNLRMCRHGKIGKIKSINAEGVVLQKLYDMGFLPGVSLEVLRVAPLNDPLQIKIHNYLIGLRADEAECIELEATEDMRKDIRN